MSRDTVTVHRVIVFVFGLLAAVLAQQLGEGNYIVPRATLDLSRPTNRSAAGRKRRCKTNADCKGFVNSLCCRTISGHNKCRKKCKTPKLTIPRQELERHAMKEVLLSGCDVGGNKVYKEGEVMKVKDGCNKCKCSKGRMKCTKRKCPPGFCLQDHCEISQFTINGAARSTDMSAGKWHFQYFQNSTQTKWDKICQITCSKCKYKNKFYKQGSHLVLHNGCKRCICKQKIWNCSSHPCKSSQDLKAAGNSAMYTNRATALLALVLSVSSVFLSRFT